MLRGHILEWNTVLYGALEQFWGFGAIFGVLPVYSFLGGTSVSVFTKMDCCSKREQLDFEYHHNSNFNIVYWYLGNSKNYDATHILHPCFVSCVNPCSRGIKVIQTDPHHSCIIFEANHSAPQMTKQDAAICVRPLGGCGLDGLGESLCVGVISACEEVHLAVTVPAEPPPAGKHRTWRAETGT